MFTILVAKNNKYSGWVGHQVFDTQQEAEEIKERILELLPPKKGVSLEVFELIPNDIDFSKQSLGGTV